MPAYAAVLLLGATTFLIGLFCYQISVAYLGCFLFGVGLIMFAAESRQS